MKKKIKIIKANTIVLEDRAGRPRLHLDAAELGDFPQITLISRTGARVAIIADDAGCCSVSIHYPDGRTAVCIGLNTNGEAGFELYDEQGRRSANLSAARPLSYAKTQESKKGKGKGKGSSLQGAQLT